ncbi:uncharacterized protein LOC128923063 [Zeugodacus cucurbitae]|nr:uncharacterized protein LOC128923063 [Zeugodacus cucurbitae]
MFCSHNKVATQFNDDAGANLVQVDNDEVIDEFLDEARYNFATRVMSNGVEVIIANDKSKPTGIYGNVTELASKNAIQSEETQQVPLQLRSVPSQTTFRPMTLAPSTLKDKMILVMPTLSTQQEKIYFPADYNQFVTKTCLTTYTYRTTYLQDGSTTVESREQVISNIATEERNYLQMAPALSLGVTLTRTPALAVGIFPTTYSYYNTILDDDHSVVQLSKHTIVNTITGPDGYINFLQSSEEATPVYETNTYYSKLTFTNILHTTGAEEMFLTTNILTQVIITESLSPRNSLLLKYIEASTTQLNSETDATLTTPSQTGLYQTKGEYDLHIYTTKTFLTTLTYLKSTLLSGSDAANSAVVPESTQNHVILNYRTRIIDNVITETIPSTLVNSALVSKFRVVLKSSKPDRRIFITTAALLNGQTVEITAMRVYQPTLVAMKDEVKTSKATTTAIITTNVPPQKTRTLSVVPTKRKAAHTQYKKSTAVAMKNQNTTTTHATRDEDSLSADSEYNEVYLSKSPQQLLKPTKPQKHQTKHHLLDNNITATTTTTHNNRLPVAVSQIIDSLNLQRLHALRPVINAMAGLLQGSFATTQNQQQLQLVGSAAVPLPLAVQTGAVVSSTPVKSMQRVNYQPMSASVVKKQDTPIYIPVQDNADYDIDSATIQTPIVVDANGAVDYYTQSLQLQSPPVGAVNVGDANNWLLNRQVNNLKQRTLPHQSPNVAVNLKNAQNPVTLKENNNFNTLLINGGIPIRPGEVITANSDVIIGKPNGIQQPQIPLTSNFGGPLVAQTPKHSKKHEQKTYKQHYLSFENEKQQLQAFDAKSTSVLSNHMSTIPLWHAPQLQHHYAQRKPVLQQYNNFPLQLSYHSHYEYNKRLPSENYDYLLRPPPPVLNAPLASREKLPPITTTRITNLPLLKSTVTPTLELLASDLQKSEPYHTIPYQIVNHNNVNTVVSKEAAMQRDDLTANNNNNHNFNNKINTINNNNLNNNNKLPSIPFVMLNTRKKYVNYYGSFPQTSPQQADFTMQYMENPQNLQNSLNPPNLRPPTAYPPYSYSALNATYDTMLLSGALPETLVVPIGTPANHQNINLHTHVFSHNVNMHAPPLTFKKEADYPKYATAVRGQIPNGVVDGTVRHNMPHIKVPHNEKQVQINLTPQNIIEQIGDPHADFVAYTKDTAHTKAIYVENNDDSAVIGSFSLANSLPTGELQQQQHGNFKVAKPLQAQTHLYVMAHDANMTAKHKQSADKRQQVINEYQRIFIPAAAAADTRTQPQHIVDDATTKTTAVMKPETSIYPATVALNIASSYYQRDNTLDEIDYLTSNSKYVTAVDMLAVNNNNASSATMTPNMADNNKNHKSKATPGNHYNTAVGDNSESQLDQHTASATNSLHEKIRTAQQQQVLQPFFSPIAAMEVNNMHTTMREQLNIANTSSANMNANRKTLRPISYYVLPTKALVITTPNDKNHTQHTPLLAVGTPFAAKTRQTLQNVTPETQKEPVYFAKGGGFTINAGVDAVYTLTDDTASKQMSKTAVNKSVVEAHLNTIMGGPNSNRIRTQQGASSHKQLAQNDTRAVNQRRHNISNLPLKQTTILKPSTKQQQQLHLLALSTVKPQLTAQHRNTNNSQAYKSAIWQPPLQAPTQKPLATQIKNKYIARTTALLSPRLQTIPISRVIQQKMPLITVEKQNAPNTHTTINYNVYKRVRPTTSLRGASSTNMVDAAFRIPQHNFHKLSTNAQHVIESRNNSTITVQQLNDAEEILLHETSPNTVGNLHEMSVIESLLESSEAPILMPSNTALLTDGGFAQITVLPNEMLYEKQHTNNLQNYKAKSQTQLQTDKLTNSTTDAIFYVQVELTPTMYVMSTELLNISKTQSTLLTTTAYEQSEDGANFANRPQATNAGHTIIQTETTVEAAAEIATESILQMATETATATVLTNQKANVSKVKIQKQTTNKIVAEAPIVTETRVLATTDIIITGDETLQNSFNDNNEFATTLKAAVPQFDNTNQQPEVVFVANETTMAKKLEAQLHNNSSAPEDSVNVEPPNNSIFIVMTNSQNNAKAKQPYYVTNVIKFGSTGAAANVTNATNDLDSIDTTAETIQLDYADSAPTRDEESIADLHDSRITINQVLLGGVLIATPPKLSDHVVINRITENVTCLPSCKMARNEVCILTALRWRCVCRPGFARMFPDRPCKPTYTYELSLHIDHFGDIKLFYAHTLSDNSTDEYKHLATVTKEAINRMVMQSDLRDIYHGVQLSTYTSMYNANNGAGNSANRQPLDLSANLLLQLSENSEEERLMAVFKKSLRLSNYSIGGTKLFTNRNGVESLAIKDFNECAHENFHDCSANAFCFNLQGTYTCSCKEGFADLSSNTIYPGRLCSAELVGCEQCHYHGKCAIKKSERSHTAGRVLCECFAWYSGSTCQLNLKILLIILIAVGTILFTLLLFCILLMCTKRHTLRKKYPPLSQSISGIQCITTTKNSGLAGIGLLRSTTSKYGIRGRPSKRIQLDKCAIIKDTSSESSQNTLLYVLKKESTSSSKKANQRSKDAYVKTGSRIEQPESVDANNTNNNEKYMLNKRNSFTDSSYKHPDQTDRSLTVMIPRAKYHASVLPQTELFHQHVVMERTKKQFEQQRTQRKEQLKSDITTPIILRQDSNSNSMQQQKSNTQKKLNNRLPKHVEAISIRNIKNDDCQLTNMHLHQLGALVSAGFEVSAIVGENLLITSSNTKSENITLAIEPSTDAIDDLEKQKQDHTARNDDARDSNIDINNKKIRSLNQTTLTLSEQQQHQIEQNKLVEQCSCRSSGENCAPGQDENNLLNSMDVWLEHCQRHEISTDAHSPRESVHAAMKHSHICFDTLASNTNDDANTMAERDVGSTFLLPHTHLYKSDKQGSDISGFDSF